MATVNGSSTIHGSGTATAGAIGLASTTTTIAEYTGEDGGEYVPALDLNPPHANAAYSFADPDLLAAVLEADVVGRFVDDAEQPTVQEILWQSDDPDAPALLVALKDREQARLLAAGRNAYDGSGFKTLALIEMRMLLSG